MLKIQNHRFYNLNNFFQEDYNLVNKQINYLLENVSKVPSSKNKTILFLKEIVPLPLARKIRDTAFFIPKLKDRNEFLELQLKKYEQGLDGNIFFAGTVKTEQNEYSFKKFFLPFPSLDLSLGWNANKNSLRAHYLEIVDDNIFVISGEGKTIFFDKCFE